MMRLRRIGMVVAAGAGLWCAGVLAATTASAATPDEATQRFMQRLASFGGVHATVVMGKLPDGLPAGLPLPNATLLGSVAQNRMMGMNGAMQVVARPVTLYYDVPGDRDAVLRAYADALRGAGWKLSDIEKRMPFRQGGFAMTYPHTEMWCSAGEKPTILNVFASPEDRAALDVSVSTAQQGAAMLCSGGFPFGEVPTSPLPTFSAANGMTIEHAGPATDGTTTGARIVSSLGLTAVFDAFAKQLRDAGWAASVATGAPTLRSQTFTKTVDGKNYVTLLSIHALDPTHYVALTDVSSL